MTERAALRPHALLLTALLTLGVLAGCASKPLSPLPLANVDLERMYGGWYIIATIPNFFEKGMVQPYDVYTRRDDGDIREDFYVRRADFDARCRHFTVHDWVLKGTRNAAWRVQIFWPLVLPFLVAYVDPEYRYAIFGEDNRKIGWIYSRTPTISDADYAMLRDRLGSLGYDPTRFKRILQQPEQLDLADFWTDGVKRPSVGVDLTDPSNKRTPPARSCHP